MKKKMISLLLILPILIYSSNYSNNYNNNNIIYNGDFKEGLNYWYLGGIGQYCNYDLIPGEEYNILQVDTFKVPDNFWDVQLLQEYKTSVAEADILLLSFNLKNPDNEVIVAIQDNGYPWEKYVWIPLPNSSQTIYYKIAFDGNLYDWDVDEVELCFFFGKKIGVFEISNVSFLNLGPNADIDSLDADIVWHPFFGAQDYADDWIQPALDRIEKIRKSFLTVKCINYNGNPLPGVEVTINQTRKYFPFGTAVAANLFGGEDYNPTYVKKVEELFNMVTIENHLKWVFIEWAHPAVDWVFDWAEEKGIPVHGHCLFWPSYKRCPPWLEDLSTDEVYTSVLSHVENYTREFKGKVVHWDVINEAISNNEIWKECGFELLVDCYKVAKENDQNALLMYNDYGLLWNNPWKQKQVIDLVKELISMGAPVEGLGIQGHLNVPYLITPKNALKNLDKMSTLNLPIYITELDIGTREHWDFHAEYFTALMTALYSHPSVKGIIQWGFWAGSHWRPDRALYNLDWTPRPAGVAFENLMFKEWRTNVTSYTNNSGIVCEKCFHGDYQVVASIKNHTVTEVISVLPDENASLLIRIDIDNNPPDKPASPQGPTSGRVKVEYTYTSCATDPDGDEIYYFWDFGDGERSGWLGPYPSGEPMEINHSWNKKGNYELKVKAKDIYNAESEWSDPLPITISKQRNNALFLRFLEKTLERFPILRYLLDRI